MRNEFRKGLLIGMLVIALAVGTVFGVGAVQVTDDEATVNTTEAMEMPAVASTEQVETSYTDAYLFGDYFVGIVELSDAGAKVLESQVGDLETWIESVVYDRTDKAMKETLNKILDDTADRYLTKEQKTQFMIDMAARGIYWVDYDSIPDDLRAQLVMMADLTEQDY